MQEPQRLLLDVLHAACISRNVLQFRYTHVGEVQKQAESRSVRPLALAFWAGVWTLAAWCETRDDFRNFRVDHIEALTTTDRTFSQKRGQRLEDYLKRARSEGFRFRWFSPSRARNVLRCVSPQLSISLAVGDDKCEVVYGVAVIRAERPRN